MSRNLPVSIYWVHGDCPWRFDKSVKCHLNVTVRLSLKEKPLPKKSYVLVWLNSRCLKDTVVLPCAVTLSSGHRSRSQHKTINPQAFW